MVHRGLFDSKMGISIGRNVDQLGWRYAQVLDGIVLRRL
jgi:hypothetical protein